MEVYHLTVTVTLICDQFLSVTDEVTFADYYRSKNNSNSSNDNEIA